MSARRVCAVIPAAGRGERLGLAGPKILAPLGDDRTVWSVLSRKIAPHVDHIHVVLSPVGLGTFRSMLSARVPAVDVSVGVQPDPVGMGDAIFSNAQAWSSFDDLLVIWGDQVHVSDDTIRSAVARHVSRPERSRITLPLVEMSDPYVQYCFDDEGRLAAVHQRREGEPIDKRGLADVGTFVLSVAGLVAAWEAYVDQAPQGRETDEINFLPFLAYLSTVRGWPVSIVNVRDEVEARGINTPEDLAWSAAAYRV